MTPIPWEVWGGWGTALAALITAIAGGLKVAAEIRAQRNETRATAARVAAVDHELRPNSGNSMRDVIDRIEGLVTANAAAVAKLTGDVEQLSRATRRHDAELGRANDALVQLQGVTADAVTRVHRRLDDHSIRLRDVEADSHTHHHRLGDPHD